MLKSQISALCLLTILYAAWTKQCTAQTPAPQQNQIFALPLADGTTANAIILPAANGQAFLVYATKTGQLGFWTMTSGTSPSPTPPPEPPPPPTPPTPPVPPTPPRVVSVITITETTPAGLPSEVSAYLSANSGSYYAFTVEMVALDEPPPNALKWIGKSAGKNYPYTFLADAAGVVLWQGPTPANAAKFLNLLKKPTELKGR